MVWFVIFMANQVYYAAGLILNPVTGKGAFRKFLLLGGRMQEENFSKTRITIQSKLYSTIIFQESLDHRS